MQVKHIVAWHKVDIDIIFRRYRGVVVHGYRGSGITEALMKDIHERHRGALVIVVTANENMARIFKQRYEELYPHDQTPTCIPANRDVRHQLAGQMHRKLYVDCWDAIDARVQDQLADFGFEMAGNTSQSEASIR